MLVVVVLPWVPATTSGLAVGKELVVEERSHAGEGDALIEDVFELRHCLWRWRCPTTTRSGRGAKVDFSIGLVDGDVEGGELIGHRRIGLRRPSR